MMQPTQSLHHQNTLPIDHRYIARQLSTPSPSSWNNIVLTEPRPQRVAECSIAWQARIAAWNSALSHPTDVCERDTERTRAKSVDGSDSTSTGSSTNNGHLLVSNKPASFGHQQAVNQEGQTSTFPDSIRPLKGSVQALPPFEEDTPVAITQSQARDLIWEVESDASRRRAFRAIVIVLSRERDLHLRKSIACSFRMEVVAFIQHTFSGTSGMRFFSSENFVAWLDQGDNAVYNPWRVRDSAKAIAVCTLLYQLIRINAMPSSDLVLAVKTLYEHRIHGHRAIILHLLEIGLNFVYPVSSIAELVKIEARIPLEDRISVGIIQLLVKYKKKSAPQQD